MVSSEGTLSANDPHDLERFVQAQTGSYERALAELKCGQKRSHWMWYIFPQLAGLGVSPMSQRYAIQSNEEAKAYLNHPVLGPRLRECAEAILQIESRFAREILGSPDDMKLKSSATLFAQVAQPESVFQQVLEKYYQGQRDQRTLGLLGLPGT